MRSSGPHSHRRAALVAAALLAAGCGREAPRPPAPNTPPPAPPRAAVPATDSLVERALAVMQAKVGPAPAALAGGAASREALVRGYVAALARRDTAALRRMQVTTAEFAHLYFPESRLRRPPSALEPDVVWLQIRAQSGDGAAEALAQFGGRPLRYVGHACADEAVREGRNQLWTSCRVRMVRAPGDTVEPVLLAQVVERGGRYKVLSYAGDL